MRRFWASADRLLLALLGIIVVLGIYNLASAGKPLGASLHVSHGAHVAVGVFVMLLLCSFHYRHLEALALPAFVGCLGLLVATSTFGKLVNGSRRWLVIGPVNVQTSDVAKLAVILIVARAFSQMRWEGGLTLREVFRPFNLSRPLVVLVAVLAVSTLGEGVRPAKLKVKSGRKYRTAKTLGPDTPRAVLGSTTSADVLTIRRSGVADEHAEVVRTGETTYILRPLMSSAPLFVNDEPVLEQRSLQHGDMIRLGTNQRAELQFSASLQELRPKLPWVSLFGAAWLFVALALQIRKRSWQQSDLIAPIDVVILPSVLILVQPDLGTTLVVLLIAFSMILYVGLRPLSYVLLFSGGAIGAAVAWFTVLKPYQKERVLTFLNPTSDLAGAGYHQHQSLIAIGSGQAFGKGHGQGTQTQLSFLPEQQTDFIFSVWAEEHGFVGSLLLVMLFCFLVLAGLRIASRARDRFGGLLVVGVTAMIFWHAVINMLMVLRLAPVVGVPLPLWSNGGSFVMTTLIGMGWVLNVSMRRRMF